MSNTTKSVDTSGVPSTIQEITNTDSVYANGGANRGVFNDTILEAVPKYIRSAAEEVISKGNSHIVLGRDRPASRASGYGGQGHTQASSIDLVVGRGGPSPDASINVDPNFRSDGARVYISQKTDIDTNFNLASGAQGNLTARSGIGIKADAVRIIGTDGIKFVTRAEPENSKGGSASYNGIELIACNDETDIQSIVKGENLVEALQELEARLSELSSIVLNHLKNQLQFNLKVASHTHGSHTHAITPQGIAPESVGVSNSLRPAGINATMDAAEGMIDNYKHRINTNILWKTKYLNSASSKYICSKYNKVN
ncbi:MAG: hypothetical protein JSV97_01320 [candidate division WOR-3 bacterium]|nr:MAG: hypothetical protein JSV97_01320 [candidate division WOR-3 bacterium]